MDTTNKSLFKTEEPLALGLGFHNVGSGVLRYAHEDMIKRIEKQYGQRGGHIPLHAKTVGMLVQEKDEDITSQIAYLSELFGRDIKVMTPADVKEHAKTQPPLVVPYALVPETEGVLKGLGAQTWGMPGKMTHVLKSKVEFHRLVEELAVENFQAPQEYTVAPLEEVTQKSKELLKQIAELYDQVGL